MELTISDPAHVTETRVDKNGRLSGLSEFKNERIKIVVERLDEEDDKAESGVPQV